MPDKYVIPGKLVCGITQKYGGGTIKQGIAPIQLDGCRVTQYFLWWQKNAANKT